MLYSTDARQVGAGILSCSGCTCSFQKHVKHQNGDIFHANPYVPAESILVCLACRLQSSRALVCAGNEQFPSIELGRTFSDKQYSYVDTFSTFSNWCRVCHLHIGLAIILAFSKKH